MPTAPPDAKTANSALRLVAIVWINAEGRVNTVAMPHPEQYVGQELVAAAESLAEKFGTERMEEALELATDRFYADIDELPVPSGEPYQLPEFRPSPVAGLHRLSDLVEYLSAIDVSCRMEVIEALDDLAL